VAPRDLLGHAVGIFHWIHCSIADLTDLGLNALRTAS
jgi:hypothetical protein